MYLFGLPKIKILVPPLCASYIFLQMQSSLFMDSCNLKVYELNCFFFSQDM